MADEEIEFQEEEMWGVVLKEKQRNGAYNSKKKKSLSYSSSTSCLSTASAWHSPLPAPPKMMIPKANSVVNEGDNLTPQHASAPLKIPDWYNMQKASKKCTGVDDANGKDTRNHGDEYFIDDEDEDEQMIPPHEYIAKKMARTRIASHSMCEGIGRTLKGRDLCKLRNAILTQTGFLEE